MRGHADDGALNKFWVGLPGSCQSDNEANILRTREEKPRVQMEARPIVSNYLIQRIELTTVAESSRGPLTMKSNLNAHLHDPH